MFAPIQKLQELAAEALDLLVDFATLGEYGFEPISPPAGCDRAAPLNGSDPPTPAAGCEPGPAKSSDLPHPSAC